MPVAVEQKLFIPMEQHHHHNNHQHHADHLDYSYGSGSESEESSGGKESKRSATIKSAPPGTIQWLKDCYELCDNNSVPRCSVYNHYSSYCSSTGINPINAASFGKVIRSVFPNLKTRRLGTRGNSKYHYLGLKLKNESVKTFEQANLSDATYNKPYESSSPPMKSKKAKKTEEPPTQPAVPPSVPQVQLPEFVLPEAWHNMHDLPFEDARMFFENYRNHCQQLLDICYQHHFAEVEKSFKTFWTGFAPRYMGLMNFGEIIDYIIDKDHLTYKSIAGVLLPNVLQALPVSLSQTIRHFAEHLEQSLAGALINAPPNLAVVKLIVARKFAQSLNKQAALNHLTQAARAVLQNATQIQAMILDWSKLDFDFIKEQASWVCQCPDEFVLAVMEGFKKHLTERATLETWAGWLQEIVFKILGKIHDSQSLLFMSQQMLLKWSFYSTLVMRDLTIRNAQSFGSFHLLRTLFDEYIFYIIESKFAFVPPPPQFYEQPPQMNHMNNTNNNNNTHYPQAPQPEPASHPSNPPGSLGERPSMSIPHDFNGYSGASFDLGRPSISLETLLSQPGTLSFLRDRSNSLFGRGSFVFSGNLVPQTPPPHQTTSNSTNNNTNSQESQQQQQSSNETDPSYFAHLAARFRSDDFTRSRNSLPRASISNLLSNPEQPPPPSGSTTPTSEIMRQFGYFNNGYPSFPSGSFSFEPRASTQFDLYNLPRNSVNPSDGTEKRASMLQEASGSTQNSSS